MRPAVFPSMISRLPSQGHYDLGIKDVWLSRLWLSAKVETPHGADEGADQT